MVLVTGGTGLVGSHLLYQLVKTNASIRAIYRFEHTLKTVKHVFQYYTEEVELLFSKIEWIQADVTDIPSLSPVFKDITKVYHCAALISFQPKDYTNLLSVNIQGTANIVNLCISNHIKKLCYVSSIAAIGETTITSDLITENTYWNPEERHSDYAITKYGAEMEVWRGAQEGLDIVIVNPGIILGPGFWKTGSGHLFKHLYERPNQFSTKGVTGYIDVKDVVKTMVTLMESAITNERYILVTESIPFDVFFDKVASELHVTYSHKIASKAFLILAYQIDWLRTIITKKRRRFTKQLANSILKVSYYNNLKIKNAIDFEFIDIDTSIKTNANRFLQDLQLDQ